MPKTLTGLNPKHPHTRLVSFRQKLKEQYRTHTTAELDVLVNAEFMKMTAEEKAAVEHPVHRHHKLDFLLTRGEVEFKARWQEEYGWPHSDCYDNGKLHLHMAQMQVEEKERSFLETHIYAENKVKELSAVEFTPQVDAELKEWHAVLLASPFIREGDKLTRKPTETPPPYDATKIQDGTGRIYSKEEFDALPEAEQKKIRAFTNYKISQLIGSGFAGIVSSGGIVDRRLVRDAIPCQQNRLLGTPAPRDLPLLEEDRSHLCEYCGLDSTKSQPGDVVECLWPDKTVKPPCAEKAAHEASVRNDENLAKGNP